MPNTQHHRGPHPEDARLFGPDAIARLRVAGAEVAWLLERGYPMRTAINVVGGHHQLEARQRLALQRATCGASQCAARRSRAIDPARLGGRHLRIDGLNLVITLEVALSGGVLLEGCDGALRDLAGLRGSYRLVDETDGAIDLVGEALASLGVASAAWLLDAPVSNSGRLRARILERASAWSPITTPITTPIITPIVTEVDLVPSPDSALVGGEAVVSSDAIVIERAASWVNLTDFIVRTRIPNAWRVVLAYDVSLKGTAVK